MASSTVLKLNDGIEMPLFGIGLYNVIENVDKTIQYALQNGYRMFDTAKYYGNELEIGQALRNSGVERNNYFVVTKLWISDHGYKKTKAAFMESLKKLGLEYVDLYLIHSPSGGKIVETWQAMEELKKDGLIRSIGVSNFNVHHLEKLKEACDINQMPLPSINQIEIHPWLQQQKIIDYCKSLGINVMGFCPLARCVKFNKTPVLAELSKKWNKTEAQILLRWAIQRKIFTIPKSSNPSRIKENAEIFDFQIDESDMEKLNALEEGLRVSTNAIERPWVE
ncbi:uncharacterized oxidoreductase YtbE-like [Rhopilema esculentum]|uniref:uncharacterized oxidoreductase YtbE-like n=1 Tax=Rhopilema esculentum TaxID=499914 RepID=UPI0031D74D93|eukprot:gene12708-3426_t